MIELADIGIELLAEQHECLKYDEVLNRCKTLHKDLPYRHYIDEILLPLIKKCGE